MLLLAFRALVESVGSGGGDGMGSSGGVGASGSITSGTIASGGDGVGSGGGVDSGREPPLSEGQPKKRPLVGLLMEHLLACQVERSQQETSQQESSLDESSDEVSAAVTRHRSMMTIESVCAALDEGQELYAAYDKHMGDGGSANTVEDVLPALMHALESRSPDGFALVPAGWTVPNQAPTYVTLVVGIEERRTRRRAALSIQAAARGLAVRRAVGRSGTQPPMTTIDAVAVAVSEAMSTVDDEMLPPTLQGWLYPAEGAIGRERYPTRGTSSAAATTTTTTTTTAVTGSNGRMGRGRGLRWTRHAVGSSSQVWIVLRGSHLLYYHVERWAAIRLQARFRGAISRQREAREAGGATLRWPLVWLGPVHTWRALFQLATAAEGAAADASGQAAAPTGPNESSAKNQAEGGWGLSSVSSFFGFGGRHQTDDAKAKTVDAKVKASPPDALRTSPAVESSARQRLNQWAESLELPSGGWALLDAKKWEARLREAAHLRATKEEDELAGRTPKGEGARKKGLYLVLQEEKARREREAKQKKLARERTGAEREKEQVEREKAEAARQRIAQARLVVTAGSPIASFALRCPPELQGRVAMRDTRNEMLPSARRDAGEYTLAEGGDEGSDDEDGSADEDGSDHEGSDAESAGERPMSARPSRSTLTLAEPVKLEFSDYRSGRILPGRTPSSSRRTPSSSRRTPPSSGWMHRLMLRTESDVFVFESASIPTLEQWARAMRKAAAAPALTPVQAAQQARVRPLEGVPKAADDDEALCRVAVCNVSNEGIEFHGPTSALAPPKLKQRSTIALPAVRTARLLDEGFWAFLYGRLGCAAKVDGMPAPYGQIKSFYTLLLPWLAEEPLSQSIQRTAGDGSCPWRTPQNCDCSAYRSLLEAVRFMLLRGSADGAPLHADACKLATLAIRAALVALARRDLDAVGYLSSSDRKVLTLATKQLAIAAVKAFDGGRLPGALLRAIHADVDATLALVASKPAMQSEEQLPGLLALAHHDVPDATSTLHPCFDRATWRDVRGLRGPGIRMPQQMPADFLILPQRVSSPHEAQEALRHAEFICLQIDGLARQETLLFPAYLKASLLQRVFTSLVPVPLPTASRDAVRRVNAWDFSRDGDGNSLSYDQQLGLLLLLQRLAEHYAGAAFSILASQAYDAPRLVVFGAMTAIADHVIRHTPADRVSLITRTLRGEELNPYELGGKQKAPFVLRSVA